MIVCAAILGKNIYSPYYHLQPNSKAYMLLYLALWIRFLIKCCKLNNLLIRPFTNMFLLWICLSNSWFLINLVCQISNLVILNLISNNNCIFCTSKWCLQYCRMILMIFLTLFCDLWVVLGWRLDSIMGGWPVLTCNWHVGDIINMQLVLLNTYSYTLACTW